MIGMLTGASIALVLVLAVTATAVWYRSSNGNGESALQDESTESTTQSDSNANNESPLVSPPPSEPQPQDAAGDVTETPESDPIEEPGGDATASDAASPDLENTGNTGNTGTSEDEELESLAEKILQPLQTIVTETGFLPIASPSAEQREQWCDIAEMVVDVPHDLELSLVPMLPSDSTIRYICEATGADAQWFVAKEGGPITVQTARFAVKNGRLMFQWSIGQEDLGLLGHYLDVKLNDVTVRCPLWHPLVVAPIGPGVGDRHIYYIDNDIVDSLNAAFSNLSEQNLTVGYGDPLPLSEDWIVEAISEGNDGLQDAGENDFLLFYEKEDSVVSPRCLVTPEFEARRWSFQWKLQSRIFTDGDMRLISDLREELVNEYRQMSQFGDSVADRIELLEENLQQMQRLDISGDPRREFDELVCVACSIDIDARVTCRQSHFNDIREAMQCVSDKISEMRRVQAPTRDETDISYQQLEGIAERCRELGSAMIAETRLPFQVEMTMPGLAPGDPDMQIILLKGASGSEEAEDAAP